MIRLLEMIEKIVEPLVLDVSGQEINRLRVEIAHMFASMADARDNREDLRESDLEVGIICPGGVVTFGTQQKDVRELSAEKGIDEILEGKPRSSLANICMEIAERYIKEEKGDETIALLELLAIIILKLYEVEKPEDLKGEKDQVLILSIVSYTNLKRENKFAFNAAWRGSQPPVQMLP